MMLAIFHKTIAHPPAELNSPDGVVYSNKSKMAKQHPEEILRAFHAAHPQNCYSITFSGRAALALASIGAQTDHHLPGHQRLFCGIEDMYCMFVGGLHNLSSLIRQYGLCSKTTNEASLVIQAYRTLRDRGPYPADQVLKDLDGSFAFVLYDSKATTIFAALSSDGKVPLFWGIAADGSVVITEVVELIKRSCGKSFAPFPTGCMYHSEGGLRSFEHPMKRMKAVPRVDSEGTMCGSSFNVDAYSQISTMPRVGSAANWGLWEDNC